jgi:peptide/nickel transport system permease protein
MARYVSQRLGHSLIVLLGVTLITFSLVHLVPGNPGRIVLGLNAPESAVVRLNHQLGLDRSLPSQYIDYSAHLVRGQLGTSITNHVSVMSLIGARLLPSMLLVVYSIVLALFIAVPLALLAAVRANRSTDHVIRFLSVLAIGMPTFWFGLLLSVLVGLKWKLLPTSGYDDSSALTVVRSLTLPAVALALFITPVFLRTLRASLVAALGSDFAEAARARGLSRRRLLLMYVLRNSLTATLTIVGVSVAMLLSAMVIVEQVFNIPGLGSLLVGAVQTSDYPTVQGVTFILAVAVIAANLITDLLYPLVDPRVRL